MSEVKVVNGVSEKRRFGFFLITKGVDVGERFLDQMTFGSGEEAVAWLEESAPGVWGKGVRVDEAAEWGGGGRWLFTHAARGTEEGGKGGKWEEAAGLQVMVRRLDEREEAHSTLVAARIALRKLT